MNKILLLTQPTPGDKEFYSRWMALGQVYISIVDCPKEEIDIIITDQITPLTNDMLVGFKNLKFIATPTTGTTHIQVDGVEVVSIASHPDLREVTSVSEYVLYQMLQTCNRDRSFGQTLKRRTLGIIGLGRIGEHVHALATSFGMRVLYCDYYTKSHTLNYLLENSDFVSLHINECPENNGFFNHSKMALMKQGSVLINTSRASVIDEDALLAHKDKFSNVILDVCNNPDKFRELKNVTITPHIAGSTITDRILTDTILLSILKEKLGV